MIITILWGLPASGKSTYAKKTKARIIDIDRMSKYYKDNLIKGIVSETISQVQYHDVILDGLITTNDIADKILSAILEHKKDLEFKIIWWEKDIESCLHNDRGRRKLNSQITIQNHPFEEPSKELIEKFNIKEVIKMVIKKKEDYQLWGEEQGLGEETFESDTWCLGGTWKDCWGNEGEVSASTQPLSFTQFDELLEKICPTITFLQYKKIYNHCVIIAERYMDDYYGGSSTHAYYECNIKKLYEILKELKYV